MGSVFNPSNPECLQIGGAVFRDLSSLIVLSAYVGAGGTYSTLRQENTGSGYVVPAGKSLYLRAIRISFDDPTAIPTLALGWGNTDVFNTGAAPTSPVYYAASEVNLNVFQDGDARELAIWLKVPTGKYPFMRVSPTPATGKNFYLYAFGVER